jgi:hypothetical protein
VLPDDVLLEIFECYNDYTYPPYSREIEAWQTLIHVCRRWRNLVLESPRRLNLRLYCTLKTPTKDALDVWPALPLIVAGIIAFPPGRDNIIAALGQSNRVCGVFLEDLDLSGQLENVLASMQVPFPELTDLRLFSYGVTQTSIPDSFLGGSAPRLRSIELSGILFPGVPNFLWSATHLVRLSLADISRSVFISPEVMVPLLSVLSNLDTLELEFKSPLSFRGPESRSLHPRNRSILPALTKIHFKGATEYLEDLVTFIDAPQLDIFRITFCGTLDQNDFDTPRLAQFINRTPKLSKRDAHVKFYDYDASVTLLARSGTLEISIPDRKLSSIARVCNSSLPVPSTVEDLYIESGLTQTVWKNRAIPNTGTLWLQLLLPFTTVKNLYLSKEFAPGVAAALQELVGGRITEVLPSLQNIFVEGLEPSETFQENIGRFVAARQLSDHLIAISVWDKDSTLKPM